MLSALLIFDFIQPAVEAASPRGRKHTWNAWTGALIWGSSTLNMACSMNNLALICFKSCVMAAHQCASVSRHKQLTNVTLLCDLDKVEINSVKSLKSSAFKMCPHKSSYFFFSSSKKYLLNFLNKKVTHINCRKSNKKTREINVSNISTCCYFEKNFSGLSLFIHVI